MNCVTKEFWLLFQDPKLAQDIESRGTGTLGSRTVTVCSGLDLVNITYTHFVAENEAIAKVCGIGMDPMSLLLNLLSSVSNLI